MSKKYTSSRRQKINKKTLHIFLGIFVVLLIIVGVYLWKKENPEVYFSLPFSKKIADPTLRNDLYTELVNQLAVNDIKVSYVNFIDNSSIEASLSSGITVLFSTNKDVKQEVASLQLILSRFRIEGRKVNKIDLRFKNAFIE